MTLACLRCGAEVVLAHPPIEMVGGVPLLVEAAAAPDGEWWLYVEVFPDGRPLDGVQRVRARPLDREDAPGWNLHACPAPRGAR